MNNMKKGLAVYVHIPYCARKCQYCDFVSYENMLDTCQLYGTRICEEIAQYKTLLSDYEVQSVFFGGGTPSFVPEEMLGNILHTLQCQIAFSKDAEITLECNPNSITLQKLQAYYAFGINRLSIGLQSLSDAELSILGRLHSSKQVLESLQYAAEAGFSNISVDLMFGIPGQTLTSLSNTIRSCAAFPIQHISLYSLILEEGTPLYQKVQQGIITPVSEETDRAMYHSAVHQLKELGFAQYEVSNFARENQYRCRHNLTYWKLGEYIGLGCAAHSCFQDIRYCNPSSLTEYLKGTDREQAMKSGQALTYKDHLEEAVMLGLRLNEGIDLRDFQAKYSLNLLEAAASAIVPLKQAGIISIEDNRLFATEKGFDLLNYIILQISAALDEKKVERNL